MNTTEEVVCGFDGNQDLYGLGVRSGIYIQVISFFLAGFHLKKESAYLQSSAFVFLLAIYIAIIRETANRTLRAPEAAIINWLIVYQIMGVVSAVKGRVSAGALLQIALIFVIFPAYIGYNLWFWWAGIDLVPPPPPGCEEFGYFFTKVDLRGWFRTFNKVMWTMSTVILGLVGCVTGIVVLVAVILNRSNIKQWWRRRNQDVDEDLEPGTPNIYQLSDRVDRFEAEMARLAAQGMPPRADEGQGGYRRNFRAQVLTFVGALAGAAVVLAVTVPPFELVIRWNKIKGVDRLDSVGQLVPFMLSLGQLVHILYSIIRGKDDVRRSDTIVEDGPCLEKQRIGDAEGHGVSDAATGLLQLTVRG